MTIGELIHTRRLQLKKTLDDIGRAVGVNRATVQRWETGNINKMNRKHIAALSNELGLDPVLFVHSDEVLFPEERQLLTAWRSADPGTQAAVRKLLDLPETNPPASVQSVI